LYNTQWLEDVLHADMGQLIPLCTQLQFVQLQSNYNYIVFEQFQL